MPRAFLPAELARTVDADSYSVRLRWSDGEAKRVGDHDWELTPRRDANRFLFTCEFAPAECKGDTLDAGTVANQSSKHWETFWNSGGAVEFDGSTDPRARELERRTVLSQYLTAIQCSGSVPPAETGLTAERAEYI